MHTQASALAYCRQPLTVDEIVTVLNALTGRMSIDSPVCGALDRCIETLEGIATVEAESALWDADDRACRRAASLAPASSIPGFARPDLSFLTILAKGVSA